MDMKIVSLTAENVKRLKAVQIKPDGAVVEIAGRNGQGKTSVLDAIAYALGGKAVQPTKPIRDGADRAEVIVDLGDLVVKRTWTANDKSYLSVESKDGAKYPSPQAVLDKLVGQLAFDPLAFIRMSPKQQVETLKAVMGVNLDDLEEQYREVFAERTLANRDLRSLESQLLAMPDIEAPEAELDIADLAKKQEEAATIAYRKDAKSRELANLRNLYASASERIARLESHLERERNEQAKLKADGERLKAEVDGIAVPEIESVRQQIAQAEEINRSVRARKARQQKRSQVDARRKDAESLTSSLNLIEKKKADALLKAKMPVPGLSFTTDGIQFNGIPFEQASGAEQLRVSVAMGLAINPKLRVMLVRDGSLMDATSLRILEEMAETADAQIWVERVTDGDGVGVVIEDGQVAMAVAN